MTKRTWRAATVLAALLPVLTVALAGCDGKPTDSQAAEESAVEEPAAEGAADPTTTAVKVHFHDSSVPPKYHRSWTITLDEEQAHLVVDSYGDDLAEETVDMPAQEWRAFVEDLPESVDDLEEPEPVDDGCSGGTSMDFVVTDGGGADTNLVINNCANDHNSAITDDIEGLMEPFTDLVHLDENTST
ncbi:MAG: hypothetical protein L0H93_16535 [Nocardioides sp.]|nr:hypothetical protein [Nocardioides sp.]